MPKKLPSSYLQKLNQELTRKQTREKSEPRVRTEFDVPGLKSFKSNCLVCGKNATFQVDSLGNCTCGNCGARANYRIGLP